MTKRYDFPITKIISSGQNASGQNICILVEDHEGSEVILTIPHELETQFHHSFVGAVTSASEERMKSGASKEEVTFPLHIKQLQAMSGHDMNGEPVGVLRLLTADKMKYDLPLPLEELDKWINLLLKVRATVENMKGNTHPSKN